MTASPIILCFYCGKLVDCTERGVLLWSGIKAAHTACYQDFGDAAGSAAATSTHEGRDTLRRVQGHTRMQPRGYTK